MEWVPLAQYEDGVILENKPRRLTPEEITYITSHVPLAPSADSDAAILARNGIIEWMAETLQEQLVDPSAIPALIARIVNQHHKSLVVPGTPVGITAAEGVGATNTQMTLNSVAPHELILLQDASGNSHLVAIGPWIDSLLAAHSDDIKHIPENRTQYLPLPEPFFIATPNDKGTMTWEKVTAVTKHLPLGHMVKITTRSGRSVTVTQSKSLLIWDGTSLVQREGSSAKCGDLVPVTTDLRDPPLTHSELDLSRFIAAAYRSKRPTSKVPERLPLDKLFGKVVGIYLALGTLSEETISFKGCTSEMHTIIQEWCLSYDFPYNMGETEESSITSNLLVSLFALWIGVDKTVPAEILLADKQFITGVLSGYWSSQESSHYRSPCVVIGPGPKKIITAMGFLCSRLGIFGTEINGVQATLVDTPSTVKVISILESIFTFLGFKSGVECEEDGENEEDPIYTYLIQGMDVARWREVIPAGGLENSHEPINPKLQTEKHNDVMLDPIVSITKVLASEYVYDLTVPTTTNFSLWNGLGVADTFHTSGAIKSATFVIDAMRDIIFARKVPKNESSMIYFTNKNISYEEVLDSRRYIVGSKVSDFVVDYDIDSPLVLKRFWWHDSAESLLRKQVPQSTKVLRLFLNVIEMFKHRVSIAELAAVLEREVPPSVVAIHGPISDGIIDIYPHPTIIMDTLKAGKRGAVPANLAELTYLETIVYAELGNIRVKGISGIRHVYPIVSPVWRIVILERKLNEEDLVNEAIREQFAPYLGRAWVLFYNRDIMKTTGIIEENLSALCQLAGLEIIAGRNDRLYVGMPNDRFRTSRNQVVHDLGNARGVEITEENIEVIDGVTYKKMESDVITRGANGWVEKVDDKSIALREEQVRVIGDNVYKRLDQDLVEVDGKRYEIIDVDLVKVTEMKPGDYVAERVMLDKRYIRDRKPLDPTAANAPARPTTIIPRTPLMKAAEFVIAETDGCNLKELLALPGIDKTRTTCNNMYTIAATLGIEAARTFIVRALVNTISNTGMYVNPANLTLIAEFITSRGEPYGATYTGISRQPGGHLSLATVERAGKVFIQSALNGRREDIRNVSASVAAGARMAIGTGSFDIAQDIVVNGVPQVVINDDLFTALQKDDETIRLASERAGLQTQVTPVPLEDLTEGIDALKTINVGGPVFDFAGAEDEVNLLALFNPGEVIPDFGIARAEQPLGPGKVVRRVQTKPITVQPIKAPAISPDLVDVLTQIKVGVPLADTDVVAGKTTITALEQGVIGEVPPPAPISAGLVPVQEFAPQVTNLVMPQGIDELIRQYELARGGEGEEPETIVENLPVVEIPRLPDITGINLTATQIELRREQIRGLEPIDTKALARNLNVG